MTKQGWLTAGLIGVGGVLLLASMWTLNSGSLQNPLQRSSRPALHKPDRHGPPGPGRLANSRKGRRIGSCHFSKTAEVVA
jgi:hypothetical protein